MQSGWLNTVLVLNKIDSAYGSTLALNGATGSLTSPDGGKTWKASTININAYDFTTGQ